MISKWKYTLDLTQLQYGMHCQYKEKKKFREKQ